MNASNIIYFDAPGPRLRLHRARVHPAVPRLLLPRAHPIALLLRLLLRLRHLPQVNGLRLNLSVRGPDNYITSLQLKYKHQPWC